MKNQTLTLSTKRDLFSKIDALLTKNPKKKYFVNITEKAKKRSLPANAVYYAWIPDISDAICEDIKTTRHILKLDFGLPIIFTDKEIGQRYGEMLESYGFFSWPREKQLAHMEFIQVTSLMNTAQHKQMRGNIEYFYNQCGLNLGYQDD